MSSEKDVSRSPPEFVIEFLERHCPRGFILLYTQPDGMNCAYMNDKNGGMSGYYDAMVEKGEQINEILEDEDGEELEGTF